jgi:hypothetical protein
MTRDQDNDDKTVKELIDAATRAELERWFGLPSFEQAAEKAPPPEEDPEIALVRERREKAIAAVDPAMLEWHRARIEVQDDLLQFKPSIEVRVNPDVALLDQTMIAKQASIADPREVEIPEELRDDLRTCTPQALLRDLHRPELFFDKTFEVVDMNAENRVDVVRIVDEVMTAQYKLTGAPPNIFREGREILRELRTDRLRAMPVQTLEKFPNRRVTE